MAVNPTLKPGILSLSFALVMSLFLSTAKPIQIHHGSRPTASIPDCLLRMGASLTNNFGRLYEITNMARQAGTPLRCHSISYVSQHQGPECLHKPFCNGSVSTTIGIDYRTLHGHLVHSLFSARLCFPLSERNSRGIGIPKIEMRAENEEGRTM
ncbi:hypothetical protein GGR50DRAFT_646811 [Xylaria sp. CBS 124048]|nr:hypothetical protein GGR50DRAFT_646811 [Xylaria sp. CBS 124048]